MKKTTLRQPAFLKFCLICITMLFSGIVSAQNSFTATSGNWNSAANWSLGHVPNGTEDLIIPAGNTCTMDVSYTGTTNTFNITISGTLNVPSGFTLDQSKATVILANNGATLSGGGTVNLYTFNVATTNATDVVNLTNFATATPLTIGKSNTAGTINLTKGLLKLTGQTIAVAKTATINGNGGDLAHTGDGSGSSADADGGTLSMVGSSGGTTTVNGSVTFYDINTGTDGNVILDLKTATSVVNGTATIISQQGKFGNTNSPIWGSSSTVNISYNSIFNYTPGKEWVSMASGTIGVTPGYPNNVILSNNGNSAGGFNNGNGWVPSGAWAINGVFTLGNNSTNAQVDFSNVSSFTCGGFVLNSNSRFTAPKATMTVNGNWTDNQAVSGTSKGFFINGTSTVVFGGAGTCASSNTLQGSNNGEAFYNLSIINGAFVRLSSAVSVANTLTLTSGIFSTTASNILSVTNTSTSAISGGSDDTYIDGPLKWNLPAGTGVYIFPVGSSAIACTDAYLPISLNKTASNATPATVQAFNISSGGTVDGTLSGLSAQYWSLATTSDLTGSSIASVAVPTTVGNYTLIAKSNTSASGVYTSIGGTASTSHVDNSTDIGAGTSLFITLGQPPIVSTLAPTSVTTTGATLQGAFNTMNASHNTSFNWGTTISYGTSVNTQHSPITSITSVADSIAITGLTANTEYHYMATDGTNSGSDVKFVTAPNAPTATAASNVSGSGFTANWTAPASQGSAPFTYTVQISADPTFATGVTEQILISSASVSSSVSGLTSATTYYYRVKAVNETTSSVWSSVISVTTNLVPTPPCTNNTSSDGATTFTTAPPVIDGTVDTVWSTAPSNAMNVVTLGTNNNTQTWKSLWSTDSLYLLVQVTDASLIGQGSGLVGSIPMAGVQQGTSANYYEADGIEFYLDADNNHGNSYDNYNDVQLRFNLGSNTLSGQSASGATQFVGATFNRMQSIIDWKMVVTPTGYLLEAAIPWGTDNTHPGIFLLPNNTYGTPATNNVVGLDIGVNDQDNTGGGRQAQIQWFGNSPSSYQHPDQFKSVGLQICPEPPIVTSPTKDSITATSAKLGATVVSAGKVNGSPSALTARGTAYSTSQPVLTNAGAEGSASLGVYSHVRTGLAPQTKYYYVGYANNAGGLTGVSTGDDFYTLSQLPTVQPTLSAVTCAGIILNWTSIQFPPSNEASQTGYIVLRRQDGSDPTTAGIKTRVATQQGDLPSGTTLVATINSGATLTYTDATAQANTEYRYLLIPFTWDGVAADSTYDYFVTGAQAKTFTSGTTQKPTFNVTPTTFCSGATAPTLPPTSTNNITGTWNPSTVSNTTGGTYIFTPTQGQCADTVQVKIIVDQSTAPTFDLVTSICSGDDAPTLPPTSTNNITGSWNPSTVSNTTGGTYTFTPAQGQCASPKDVTINVTTPPSVSISANKTSIAFGDSVILTGNNIDGSYLWSSSPSADFTPQGAASTVSHPNVPTLYKLTVTEGICSGSDTVTVFVENRIPCPVVPPKAFTPNGDGIKDTWEIMTRDAICDVRLEVNIYNRWGGLIKHYIYSGYGSGWDGRYNGNPVADGTYYYVIAGTFPDGTHRTVTGNVTIVR